MGEAKYAAEGLNEGVIGDKGRAPLVICRVPAARVPGAVTSVGGSPADPVGSVAVEGADTTAASGGDTTSESGVDTTAVGWPDATATGAVDVTAVTVGRTDVTVASATDDTDPVDGSIGEVDATTGTWAEDVGRRRCCSRCGCRR